MAAKKNKRVIKRDSPKLEIGTLIMDSKDDPPNDKGNNLPKNKKIERYNNNKVTKVDSGIERKGTKKAVSIPNTERTSTVVNASGDYNGPNSYPEEEYANHEKYDPRTILRNMGNAGYPIRSEDNLRDINDANVARGYTLSDSERYFLQRTNTPNYQDYLTNETDDGLELYNRDGIWGPETAAALGRRIENPTKENKEVNQPIQRLQEFNRSNFRAYSLHASKIKDAITKGEDPLSVPVGSLGMGKKDILLGEAITKFPIEMVKKHHWDYLLNYNPETKQHDRGAVSMKDLESGKFGSDWDDPYKYGSNYENKLMTDKTPTGSDSYPSSIEKKAYGGEVTKKNKKLPERIVRKDLPKLGDGSSVPIQEVEDPNKISKAGIAEGGAAALGIAGNMIGDTDVVSTVENTHGNSFEGLMANSGELGTEGAKGVNSKEIAGSTLSGAGQGASAGATLGTAIPVVGPLLGAGVGALVGGTAGFFGGRNAEKDRIEQLKEQQKIQTNKAEAVKLGNINANETVYQPMMVNGGDVNNRAMNPNLSKTPILRKYNGENHNNGSNGGIEVDDDGNPTSLSGREGVALTENNEVNFNGYIFSDSIKYK